MIRRMFRLGVWAAVLGGIGYAVMKALGRSQPSASEPAGAPPQPWPRLDAPSTTPSPTAAPAVPAPVEAPTIEAEPAPEPRWADDPALVEGPADVAGAAETAPASAEPTTLATWVDPEGDICPASHPVKAKLSSKIFQVRGNFAYDRTTPDRCYKDAAAAEADGFRAAKR